MKLSKASWMILAAGVFIIVLAGLGMTRSGQIKEYDTLSSNLTLLSARLNKMPANASVTEIEEYKQQISDMQMQADEAKLRLEQSVISVDVADKFYQIAAYDGVTVQQLSTTAIASDTFAAVNCEVIYVAATVTGDAQNIVDFIIALNDNFSTGLVNGAQFTFDGTIGKVGVQLTVYSRKGS